MSGITDAFVNIMSAVLNLVSICTLSWAEGQIQIQEFCPRGLLQITSPEHPSIFNPPLTCDRPSLLSDVLKVRGFHQIFCYWFHKADCEFTLSTVFRFLDPISHCCNWNLVCRHNGVKWIYWNVQTDNILICIKVSCDWFILYVIYCIYQICEFGALRFNLD